MQRTDTGCKQCSTEVQLVSERSKEKIGERPNGEKEEESL